MAKSKRSHEGYLLIDHRACPGVEHSVVPNGAPAVGAGATYESATVTCSHCQRVVILNPMRSRERGYCPKCDHYICDSPGCNAGCVTMNQLFDIMQEKEQRALRNGTAVDQTITDLRRDILGT